jgi:hypothetical protein
VSLLQIVAAALVTVGSVLVLRAVWLADVGTVIDAPPQEAAAMIEHEEWREAA